MKNLEKNGSPGIVRPGPMIRHPVKVTHCLLACYLFKSWDLTRKHILESPGSSPSNIKIAGDVTN